ncbi:hypothetical protein EAI_09941 [Harpegnathos saltator]|uniref:Uncharacterized protein n=1 Tax=Harpegnathos saltator TaxID=610380 RepID=E2BIA0_HARSA|nr:hypothetical protein EAI_09941 [Harpegnathos saltator]
MLSTELIYTPTFGVQKRGDSRSQRTPKTNRQTRGRKTDWKIGAWRDFLPEQIARFCEPGKTGLISKAMVKKNTCWRWTKDKDSRWMATKSTNLPKRQNSPTIENHEVLGTSTFTQDYEKYLSIVHYQEYGPNICYVNCRAQQLLGDERRVRDFLDRWRMRVERGVVSLLESNCFGDVSTAIWVLSYLTYPLVWVVGAVTVREEMEDTRNSLAPEIPVGIVQSLHGENLQERLELARGGCLDHVPNRKVASQDGGPTAEDRTKSGSGAPEGY